MKSKALSIEKGLRTACVVLAFLGLYLAAVLSVAHTVGRSVPCGLEADCDAVLRDRWSVLLGAPLPFWGMFLYAALIVIAMTRLAWSGQAPQTVHRAGFALSSLGALSSLVLTAHTVFGLHTYCVWCVGSAIVLCVSFTLYALSDSSAQFEEGGWRTVAFASASLLYVAGGVWLTDAYVLMPAKTINGYALSKLKLHELAPLDGQSVGRADATTILVVFFDPNCPSCAALDPYLASIPKRRQDVRVAFHFRPWDYHTESASICALMAAYADTHGIESVLRVVSDLGPAGTMKTVASALDDGKRLREGLTDRRHPAWSRVNDDLSLAQRLKVVSTPTIIEVKEESRRVIGEAELKDKYGSRDSETLHPRRS